MRIFQIYVWNIRNVRAKLPWINGVEIVSCPSSSASTFRRQRGKTVWGPLPHCHLESNIPNASNFSTVEQEKQVKNSLMPTSDIEHSQNWWHTGPQCEASNRHQNEKVCCIETSTGNWTWCPEFLFSDVHPCVKRLVGRLCPALIARQFDIITSYPREMSCNPLQVSNRSQTWKMPKCLSKFVYFSPTWLFCQTLASRFWLLFASLNSPEFNQILRNTRLALSIKVAIVPNIIIFNVYPTK